MRSDGTRTRCCLRGKYDDAHRGRLIDGDVDKHVHSGGLLMHSPIRTASAAMCRGDFIVYTRVIRPHPEPGSSHVSCYPLSPHCQHQKRLASLKDAVVYVYGLDRFDAVAAKNDVGSRRPDNALFRSGRQSRRDRAKSRGCHYRHVRRSRLKASSRARIPVDGRIRFGHPGPARRDRAGVAVSHLRLMSWPLSKDGRWMRRAHRDGAGRLKWRSI